MFVSGRSPASFRNNRRHLHSDCIPFLLATMPSWHRLRFLHFFAHPTSLDRLSQIKRTTVSKYSAISKILSTPWVFIILFCFIDQLDTAIKCSIPLVCEFLNFIDQSDTDKIKFYDCIRKSIFSDHPTEGDQSVNFLTGGHYNCSRFIYKYYSSMFASTVKPTPREQKVAEIEAGREKSWWPEGKDYNPHHDSSCCGKEGQGPKRTW